ncbi:hypothetical protein H0H87_010850 [Tephrocybe sp. NHM501043]|nr:hypothetical protein H0H87_010850 [Tephrocybe sp. NHM501043]
MSHPSQIPKHASRNSKDDIFGTMNASEVHHTLLSLGAPPVSLDDFTRLYHGPFGELLLFMSTQIKGRKQVARDRHLIHQFRESQSKSPARVPGELASLMPAPKSIANLTRSQKEMDSIKTRLQGSQVELEEAQLQVAGLKQMLQEKRRVALLLGTLEERERVRINRFQEIIKMLETLRTASIEMPSNIERCCEIAHAKAKIKMRYQDKVLDQLPCISKEALIDKAKANQQKRQELQRLSDKVIALGFLCEHLITSISVFTEQTSPVLRSSIQEYIPSAKGYIDILRLRMAASTGSSEKPKERSFMEEVQRACKIRVGQDPEATLREVEELVRRAKEHSAFLATVDALRAPSPTADEEALIADYCAGVESVEKRAREVLARKVEKAARGDSLIEDLDTIMREVKTLVG